MFSHLLVAAGFLAASFPALAQTGPPPGSASPAAPSSQEQSVITKQDESQVRVYRLVGSKAIGPDGQAIGKVDDLLLDRDQRMVAVIVSVGGFLGMGSKSVALPAGRVDISQAFGDEERVVKVDATKEELIAAPAFKTREIMKAEAEEQAARARALQNMPPGTPGAPRPLPTSPMPSGGSSTQQ